MSIKKISSIILTFLLILSTISAGLITVNAEGLADYLTYTVSNGEVTITDCDTSAAGDMVVPATIDGCPVTAIGSKAFYVCKLLTSITLPDSIKTIDSSAFLGCIAATKINIPDGITQIGDFAFQNCTALASVDLPDSVTSLGLYSFYGCTALTSISIPNSVTAIGQNAFQMCSALADITLPDSNLTIGSSAFDSTAYYNKTANWQNNVLYIGKHLIKANTSVSGKYTVNSGTLTIAGSAFENCTALTSVVIPVDVTEIGDSAFKNCTKLSSVTLQKGLTSIDSKAFYGCTALTSITVPDGVTTVGANAFNGCTKLTSITLPDSIRNIGNNAFYETGYYNTASNWEDDVLYIGNYLIKAKVSVSGEYTVKSGTLFIVNNAFEQCTLLTNIELPESLIIIESSAFSGCTGLTEITIPDSVTRIGYGVFKGCTGLTSVTLPNNDTSIGSLAFQNCTSVTSLTINGITNIGSNAFLSCSSVESLYLSKSVVIIGKDAFSGLRSLTDIYYNGTEEEWNAIAVDSGNEYLSIATLHFISMGDLNCDETQNSQDLALFRQLLLSGGNSMFADITDDGKIDLKDLVSLKKTLAEIA